jgi:hypothetical protein
MKMYIIRFENGEYLTGCRITSNYLEYERTAEKSAAHELNDFDSRLVLKRLSKQGKKAQREEI